MPNGEGSITSVTMGRKIRGCNAISQVESILEFNRREDGIGSLHWNNGKPNASRLGSIKNSCWWIGIRRRKELLEGFRVLCKNSFFVGFPGKFYGVVVVRDRESCLAPESRNNGSSDGCASGIVVGTSGSGIKNGDSSQFDWKSRDGTGRRAFVK